MGAILGGLFNSRLNMKLREEKGYTYGAGAGFDRGRGAGPFNARAAVNTEVTLPAVQDFLAELDRIRDVPVEASELRAARDFLVGVFPLRFETPGPIVGSLAGLIVHDLPDDELARYRPAIEAVTIHARPSPAARRPGTDGLRPPSPGPRLSRLSAVHRCGVRRQHRQLDADDRPGLARPRADRLAIRARRDECRGHRPDPPAVDLRRRPG